MCFWKSGLSHTDCREGFTRLPFKAAVSVKSLPVALCIQYHAGTLLFDAAFIPRDHIHTLDFEAGPSRPGPGAKAKLPFSAVSRLIKYPPMSASKNIAAFPDPIASWHSFHVKVAHWGGPTCFTMSTQAFAYRTPVAEFIM